MQVDPRDSSKTNQQPPEAMLDPSSLAGGYKEYIVKTGGVCVMEGRAIASFHGAKTLSCEAARAAAFWYDHAPPWTRSGVLTPDEAEAIVHAWLTRGYNMPEMSDADEDVVVTEGAAVNNGVVADEDAM